MPLMKLGDPSGGAAASEDKLSLRRVDAVNLGLCTTFDEQLGECAVAAADIDPSQARTRREPLEEIDSDEAAPGPHHALVGCPILKADFLVRHFLFAQFVSGR